MKKGRLLAEAPFDGLEEILVEEALLPEDLDAGVGRDAIEQGPFHRTEVTPSIQEEVSRGLFETGAELHIVASSDILERLPVLECGDTLPEKPAAPVRRQGVYDERVTGFISVDQPFDAELVFRNGVGIGDSHQFG